MSLSDKTRPDGQGDDSSIWGQVDTVNPSTVSGWLGADIPYATAVKLVIAGIEIRTHRAELPFPNDAGKRRFEFKLSDGLRDLLPPDSPVTACLDAAGTPLPLAAGVPHLYPGRAQDGGDKLRMMLAGKWQIDHWGNLHKTFGSDPTLITRSARIYSEARGLIRDVLDRELYVTGGNLLGLVREGKFLDHDDDIDASIILQAETANEAAEQFFKLIEELAPRAAAAGFEIQVAGALHFYCIRPGMPYLDVLVGWFTSGGYWCRPSGYGGDLGVSEFRFAEVIYADTKMAIPEHATTELVLTYGPGWNRKDNHYSKNRPSGPLKAIQSLQWKSKDRVAEINAWLSGIFEGKGR